MLSCPQVLYKFILSQNLGDNSIKMQLLTLASLVALWSTVPTALCHTEGGGLPALRFFGGEAAIKDLRARSEAKGLIEKRLFSDPDVSKGKKCGPGVGYCDDGDW